MKKEGLITNLFKSGGSNAERNYVKHFNINTNVNNNVSNNTNVNNNAHDDDTYDVKYVILE